MKFIIRFLFVFIQFLFIGLILSAKTYQANPDNYQSFLNNLQPGDTLFLTQGTYKNCLILNNINGNKDSRIIISGEGSNKTVFEARDGVNTISITKCSFITISNLGIDGKSLTVDAVKAEGTNGNYANDITIENLDMGNFGTNQQIVGINTKCTAWNWIIRNNKISGAGTGIYLGNSDGTAPFVNGIIENNFITNTIGYNMEIKFQLDSQRTIPGMVLNGKTIIRNNVFTKNVNSSTGSSARPNVLVGNFPSSGDGSNDVYEIYGNFFFRNPVEALFQGTGNIALYSNIFVNNNDTSGARVAYITQQNNFQPRNVAVFHNTVWAKNPQGGIRMYNADKSYKQYCRGNAVFSPNPVSNFADMKDNITDSYENAGNYVNYISDKLDFLDLYPLDGKLQTTPEDMSIFKNFTDWDKDFNGSVYNTSYRGAYSGSGKNKGWKLNLDNRPDIDYSFDWVDYSVNILQPNFRIYPNPAKNRINIDYYCDSLNSKIQIYSNDGTKVLETNFKRCMELDDLSEGIYYLKIISGNEISIRKFIIIR